VKGNHNLDGMPDLEEHRGRKWGPLGWCQESRCSETNGHLRKIPQIIQKENSTMTTLVKEARAGQREGKKFDNARGEDEGGKNLAQDYNFLNNRIPGELKRSEPRRTPISVTKFSRTKVSGKEQGENLERVGLRPICLKLLVPLWEGERPSSLNDTRGVRPNSLKGYHQQLLGWGNPKKGKRGIREQKKEIKRERYPGD